jgi:serine/threonine protein kinase
MHPGQRLSGRYALEVLLGSGGMGEVWRALDEELDRPVAVKVLREVFADPELAKRFRREARIAARLQHPGITVVHDVGSDDGRLFMVMELLHGRDLGAVLAEAPAGLPVGAVVSLAIQAAGALQAAHAEHVVHRDLKPANLFLLTDGQLKLCDFGIARAVDATAGLTHTGQAIGTPAYMSPEQCLGKQVAERSDLYSLGCVMYALLAGRPPFAEGEPLAVMFQHLNAHPPPLRTTRPDLSPELDRLVMELLAKDPAHRPADASHVTAALQALQYAPTVPAMSVGKESHPAGVLPGHPGDTPGFPPTITISSAAIPFPEPELTRKLSPNLAHTFERPGYGVESMAWQPHGELLATGNGDSSVTLFNTSTGQKQRLFQVDLKGGILDDPCPNWVYWSPDGRYLASWPGMGCGGTPSVWDSRTRAIQVFDRFDESEWDSVGWRRDGLMRAREEVRANYQERKTLHASQGNTVRLISQGPRWSVGWSDSEQTFVLGEVTSRGRWDASKGARLPVPRGSSGRGVTSLAWSSDGLRLAVYRDNERHADGRIEIWDLG